MTRRCPSVCQCCVRACVRVCVCVFTLSNMNISQTSKPIAIKFYRKHHWGKEKAALGFEPDRIKTLVSMATDRSHRIIMGNLVSTLAPSFLIGSSSFSRVRRTTIKSQINSKFGPIRPWTAELAALELLKKSQT